MPSADRSCGLDLDQNSRVARASVMIFVRALYGLKSEEAACREMFSRACSMITVQWIPGENNLEEFLSNTTIT